MGFLEAGLPMEWMDDEEYHKILDYVRIHGVDQFINTWNNVKSRTNDSLFWGDEIEFHIFVKTLDDSNANGSNSSSHSTSNGSSMSNNTPKLKLLNKAADLLEKLEEEDKHLSENEKTSTWHPEYGAWMIEATPSSPYGGYSDELCRVEPNMRRRRFRITRALKPNEGVITMVAWPLMGVGDFCYPPAKPLGNVSESIYIPDACINPHPRFATLTRNIRKRRGQKVNIHVPLFMDENTSINSNNTSSSSAASTLLLKDGDANTMSKIPPGLRKYEIKSKDNLGMEEAKEIYMDAMGFGMGCCCLQVTFQARDLTESRHLYDQLSVLCPIFLTLTAGAPIFKGLLADTDVRWSTISQSVDCRTPYEKGVSDAPNTLPGATKPQRGSKRIQKSRYDAISLYISPLQGLKDEYNDMNAEIDLPTFEKLISSGVDKRLAQHIAHLYIRDPLVIFSDRVEVDDSKTTEHFENIQSTNWQTMRWKPPPPSSKNTGWRVEFRPMEVQFTDFENAAFTVVIALLARVILFFDLNLYIPISKVYENMQRAHSRNAVLEQKFYFRKNLIPLEKQCPDPNINKSDEKNVSSSSSSSSSSSQGTDSDTEVVEMTVREILLGKGNDYPGLVPLIWSYLDIINVDNETHAKVNDYIDLITARCKGELPTPAQWIRNFVAKHPDYKKDSIISDTIAHDLVQEINAIAIGSKQDPSLLGNHYIVPLDKSEEIDKEYLNRGRNMGMRLRGASFQDELGMTQEAAYKCAIVRGLLEQYTSAAKEKAHTISQVKTFDMVKPVVDLSNFIQDSKRIKI